MATSLIIDKYDVRHIVSEIIKLTWLPWRLSLIHRCNLNYYWTLSSWPSSERNIYIHWESRIECCHEVIIWTSNGGISIVNSNYITSSSRAWSRRLKEI